MLCFRRGDAISVASGEVFEIELVEPGSTGYAWEPIFETRCLTLAMATSALVPTVPGASTLARFHFRGLRSGGSKLRFRLIAPWDIEPADEISFDVTVRKAR